MQNMESQACRTSLMLTKRQAGAAFREGIYSLVVSPFFLKIKDDFFFLLLTNFYIVRINILTDFGVDDIWHDEINLAMAANVYCK